VLEPLEIRVRIGADTLVVESRPGPEATWRNAWQDLSKRFSYENSAALAALDVTPAVFALLALFQQNFRYAAGTALRPGEPRVRTWLHALLMHPLARSLVTTPAGAPVAFSPDPLRWQLQGTAGHDQEYRLGLRLPDGQPLPPDTLYLPGDPNCYLHRGTVYAGPPALDGNSAAAALVPAEVIEEPEIVARLQQGGAVLPSDLAARIVTVPLGARLDCLLETNPAGQEVLLVSLHAVSREPPYEKEWTAAGLAYGDALNPTPTTDVAGRILTFDDRVPTETARRLSEFRLYYSPPQECWVRRITRSFPEEFLAWREALPPEVEVRASGELASLLGAPVRASVDFSLLESTTHRDWFDLALALKPEDSTLTPEEIALLLRARGKLVRLPGKGWRRLTVHLDDATAEALAAAGFEPDTIAEAALAGEKHRFHALQLAQSKLADRLPERHAAELRARAQEPRATGRGRVARHPHRRTPSLPARGLPVSHLPRRQPPRRRAGRRHGPRQDRADARVAALACGAPAGRRTAARPRRLPQVGRRQLGNGDGPLRRGDRHRPLRSRRRAGHGRARRGRRPAAPDDRQLHPAPAGGGVFHRAPLARRHPR
jgi:hypothetical protein